MAIKRVPYHTCYRAPCAMLTKACILDIWTVNIRALRMGSESASGAAKGGRTRAERLSPEERQAIAREAALARWGDVLPRAVASGALSVGDRTISCAVLDRHGEPDTPARVLTQGSVLRAIGRLRGPKMKPSPGDLAAFLSAENLRPYLDENLLRAATPIKFRGQSGEAMVGYEAELLPKVCRVYLDANADQVLRKSQEPIARNCAILLRGLTEDGVVGLVDAATGYAEARARDELYQILEHYIAPELMPWTRAFPEEFFRQIYRLQEWDYRPGTAKRTPFVGHLINKYIYEQLPAGIRRELRSMNPKVADRGYRRFKRHRVTSADTGSPHVDMQVAVVTTLMRVSADRADFQRLLAAAFDRTTEQRLPLVVDVRDAKIAIAPTQEYVEGSPWPG